MLQTDNRVEDRWQAFSEASLSIAEADDLDRVLVRAAEAARTLIGAHYAAVGVSRTGAVLERVALCGAEPTLAPAIWEDAEGWDLLQEVIRQERSVHLAEVAAESLPFEGGEDAPSVMNFLGTPLWAGDKLLGGMILLSKKEGADFSQADLTLLESLAGHTAVAVRKAIMLQVSQGHRYQLEARTQQLAALNEAAIYIAAQLSLDKVLQQIVDSARKLANASYAALGVTNPEGKIETFIHSGMSREEVRAIPHLPEGLGLLGAIIQEKRAIRLPDMREDPRSVGFPPNHPPMSSFLGVPIVGAGETLGNLYLTNKRDGREFSATDQMLVEMLSSHAAVAIQNARLYDQVGRLAITEERNRIGMDLHDGVIQAIYAVGLTLESTRLVLPDSPQEADELLGHAIEALNNTIRDIRNFILDLRPHQFRGNLREGLARLVREFQANTMVLVSLHAPNEVVKGLTTPIARSFFLTTQEALANVARHSRAKHVDITVEEVPEGVALTVADDGQGFDPRFQTRAMGHGLSNMRARAEELGGTFTLESAPGEGTAVRVVAPM